MKKIVGIISLLSIILMLAGCSTDKKTDTLESSKSTITSSLAKKEKKAEEKKAKEEAEKKEAEKKKQEEISKKVSEADAAMKAAEANPTDEAISAAKAAIEAIPGGNAELLKRLEVATQNLESIKQQAGASQVQQQQASTSQAEQPQVNADQEAEWQAELARRKEVVRQDELARQAEIERQIEENKSKYPPTIETDENGRTYIFENHDAYKDEPYYVGE